MCSGHVFVLQASRKYVCSICHRIVNQKDIRAACASACSPSPAEVPAHLDEDTFRVVEREVRLGGKQLHPSHTLQFWPRYSLFFCLSCGRTAAVEPRNLLEACEPPSKKGKENLRWIERRRIPSYAGPTGAGLEAQLSRIRREHALSAMTPGRLWSERPEESLVESTTLSVVRDALRLEEAGSFPSAPSCGPMRSQAGSGDSD